MRIVLLTSLLLVGCLKPQPPAPPPVIVVEIRPIPISRTYGTIVDVEVVEEMNEPAHTWMTGDELQKAIESRKDCHCRAGDPLCGCLE